MNTASPAAAARASSPWAWRKKNSAVVAAFPVEEVRRSDADHRPGPDHPRSGGEHPDRGPCCTGRHAVPGGRAANASSRSSASKTCRATGASSGSDWQERDRAKARIGLYPGTFDPVTLGHLDIIKRAVKLVDHLVIGVATKRRKAPLFTLEERVAMWRHEAEPLAKGRATIEVMPSTRTAGRFRREVGASVIIRGLRAVSDFEYEFQMVAMNQRLNMEDRNRRS